MNAMIRVGLAAALLAVGGNAAGVTGQQAGAAMGDVDTTEGLEAPAADPSAPAGTDVNAVSFSAIEATGRQIFEHDRIVVTFIDETPNALYRMLVSAEGEPSPLLPLEAPTPLSAFEAGAATARRLALQSPFQPTRRNEVPVGGTYRIEGGRDDDHPYPGSGAHGGTRALESLG